MSTLLRALCLALVVEDVLTLQLSLQCTASRLPASRVAGVARPALVSMCDAAAAEEAPAEEAAAPAPKAKAAKTPLEELQVGQEVEGKIRSVMAYGAFVDIGAATDALLHVSEISNEFIKDATEKLTAGESITCKIKGVNLEKQQLALTCKEPRAPRAPRVKVDLSEFESADEKEFITGKVNSITDFGAFVTLKEGVDGLVHISQVQEGGVGKVSDVLTVGQEVQVRVTSVDKSKRRIGLSMLQWKEKSEREERGGGGRFQDAAFGEADKEFQMNAEELDALTVGGEDYSGVFAQALARAEVVKSAKASRSKYAKQVI